MSASTFVLPTAPILVLDGEQRASLAVARSLVRAGFRVQVTSGSRWSLAGATRGAEHRTLASDALRAPEAYAREVAALAATTDAVAVIPITDASAESVLGHAEFLPAGVRLPFAPYATYRAASDKVHVHRLALESGIGIPDTAVIERKGDPVPDEARFFPGFLKPHRSVVGRQERVKTGVKLVHDHAACAAVLAALPPDAFPVLLQRRVHGPGEGVFLARWGGRTIARFAHRRLREKPPAGGVSVYRESIPLDPAVLTGCERLLDALEWQGVAMVEGKRDRETGAWRVMEINGRFWGSLQLAIDAGVDVPALLMRAVLGGGPEPIPPWETGVRLRWELGDLDHLLIRLRRSRQALGLDAEAPGRLATLGTFLTHRFGRDRLEVLRLSDPLPFVVELLSYARLVR